MIIQCGWCKKLIGSKAPIADKAITHSICKKCSEKIMKQYEKGAA